MININPTLNYLFALLINNLGLREIFNNIPDWQAKACQTVDLINPLGLLNLLIV